MWNINPLALSFNRLVNILVFYVLSNLRGQICMCVYMFQSTEEATRTEDSPMIKSASVPKETEAIFSLWLYPAPLYLKMT